MEPQPTISATVRRARQLSDGSWVTVELGASKAGQWPQDDDDRIKESGQLARALDVEVIAILAPKPAREKPPAAVTPVIPAPARREEIDEPAAPWCDKHQTPFEMHGKENRSWWSHPAPDGRWCNQQGGST